MLLIYWCNRNDIDNINPVDDDDITSGDGNSHGDNPDGGQQ